MRARNPASVTTSTLCPSSSWRSMSSPPRSNSPRSASRSTRKSMSLASVASPRATEPKIQTRDAPRARAVSRISLRRLRKSVNVGTLTTQRIDPVVGSEVASAISRRYWGTRSVGFKVAEWAEKARSPAPLPSGRQPGPLPSVLTEGVVTVTDSSATIKLVAVTRVRRGGRTIRRTPMTARRVE